MIFLRRWMKTLCSAKLCLLLLMLGSGAVLISPLRVLGEEVAQPGLTRKDKAVLLNAAAVGGVLTYGTFMWHYWDQTPHVQSEGWFGKSTKHGGADKAGHMYTGYLAGRISSNIYRSWGYDRKEAAGLGAITSLLLTGAMEAGDSFSDYGFSPEDMVANMAGAGLGYLLERFPDTGDFIDFRIEYAPPLSRIKADPLTDYEYLKYMLAFRFAGFDSLKESPLRYIDLLTGYYTRNFQGDAQLDRRERDLFIGVGLDLSELLSFTSVSVVFRYLELPYTYIQGTKEF